MNELPKLTLVETPARKADHRQSTPRKGVDQSAPRRTPDTPPFDKVVPWPDFVYLAEVLEELRLVVQRHLVCEPETAVAVALWTAFTWVIDFVEVAPLAVITAPEKRCGKTRLLELMSRFVRRPVVASNLTPAVTFRVIEKWQPTLLIDEADTFVNGNPELRGVLNSGHTRRTAAVLRSVGDRHEPTTFSTWCPKVIAGIGTFADTLMDRAIELRLRRKLAHETVEPLRHHRDDPCFTIIPRKLARFAEFHGSAIRKARPSVPDVLDDRAQDNWEPLLAIADIAGEDWSKLARQAAIQIYAKNATDNSLGTQLLVAVRQIFEEASLLKLPTSEIMARLRADAEGPWDTCNNGKPITPHYLSKVLRSFGIKSKKIRCGAPLQGYLKEDFLDAWRRYTDAPFTGDAIGTPEQPRDSKDFDVPCAEFVPEHRRRTGARKPQKTKGCSGVPDVDACGQLNMETLWDEFL